MHRVASRQRLFSWDHFDASPANQEDNDSDIDNDNDDTNLNRAEADDDNDNDIDNDDLSDYRTCISMSRHASMLFQTSTSFGLGQDNDHEIDSDNEIDNDHDNGSGNDRDHEQGHGLGLGQSTDDQDAGNRLGLTNVVSDDEVDHDDQDDDGDDEVDDQDDSNNIFDTSPSSSTSSMLPMAMMSASLPMSIPSMPTPSSMAMYIPPLFANPTINNHKSNISTHRSSSSSSSNTPTKEHSQSFILDIMNQDVQLHILSFLDLHSLRSIYLTSRYFMTLLSEPSTTSTSASACTSTEPNNNNNNTIDSCARNAIWWNVMKQMWPFLSLTTDTTSTTTTTTNTTQSLLSPDMVQFVTNGHENQKDNNHKHQHNHQHQHKNNNYGALLTQAATQPPPTCIDSSFFECTTNARPNHLIRLEQNFRVNHRSVIVHRRELHHGNGNGPTGGNTDSSSSSSRHYLFKKYIMNVNKGDLNSFSKKYLSTIQNNNISNNNNNKNDDKNDNDNNEIEQKYMLEVVQYVGRVGVGDRSIRSDQPFPRPLVSLPVFVPERKTKFDAYNDDENDNYTKDGNSSVDADCTNCCLNNRGRKRSLSVQLGGNDNNNTNTNGNAASTASSMRSVMNRSAPMNFLERLRSCNRHSGTVGSVMTRQHQHMGFFANRRHSHHSRSSTMNNLNGKFSFVSPMVSKSIYGYDDNNNTKLKRFMEIDLTPRQMAYFEVSILPRDESQETYSNDTQSHLRQLPIPNNLDDPDDDEEEVIVGGQNSSACVAIGLSTREYQSSVRMPGWDVHSYGYHGDDGGIFHSRGDMIRVYGPKYNVGDTVGCGVNYLNGGIFFTLNGDFLGYAWCNEKVVMEGRVDLFPTIGVDSSNPLACNFGNDRPFVWDLPKFIATNGSLSIP
jgi:hypothetical protein